MTTAQTVKEGWPGPEAAGILLAIEDRPRSSGTLLAFAVAARLFELAYLPLALYLLIRHDEGERPRSAFRFLAAFLIGLTPFLVAMVARTTVFHAPWFLSQQYKNVGGTGIVSPAEWSWAVGWWAVLRHLFGTPLIWLLFFASVSLRLLARSGNAANRGASDALVAFCVMYFLFLVIMRSPIYDRYMVLLLPPACVVAGIAIGDTIAMIKGSSPRRLDSLAALTVLSWFCARHVAVVVLSPFNAADAFLGYRDLCEYLRHSAMPSPVVWDHILSWHLAYCLDGSNVQSLWYANVAAIGTVGSEMYLAVSARDDPEDVRWLREKGWRVDEVRGVRGRSDKPTLWLYRIAPPLPSAPVESWR